MQRLKLRDFCTFYTHTRYFCFCKEVNISQEFVSQNFKSEMKYSAGGKTPNIPQGNNNSLTNR